jgi:UDP-N-acetylmuramate dehydrogenase
LFEREKGVKAREGRVPAGWLIEKAGFKGATYGGAQASMQHPNYLVNASGEATSAEVLELADTIKEAVREQFGVELSEEAAYLV